MCWYVWRRLDGGLALCVCVIGDPWGIKDLFGGETKNYHKTTQFSQLSIFSESSETSESYLAPYFFIDYFGHRTVLLL